MDRCLRAAGCLTLIGAFLAPTALRAQAAGTETTVYTFTGGADGQNPTDLVPFSDGNFYGTSINTVFKVTPAGTFTTLYTFCAACPTAPPEPAGLVVGSDGNFYGLTAAADSLGASFFKITSAGTVTFLNSSVPGNPANSLYEGDGSKLVLGTDGNFYGTDSGIGTSGSIFKLAPDGTFTTLYSFSATSGPNETNGDGATPFGRLVQGSDGNLYGTTRLGGTYGSGTVFRITPVGVFTSLYSFGAIGTPAGTPGQNLDGLTPVAGLVEGSDGDFYGGTTSGGQNGIGTLFKISAAGTLTALHQFSNAIAGTLTLSVNPTTITLGQSATLTWASSSGASEGGGPLHSLTLGQDGNLYGFGGEVASANDTVFQLTPAGLYTTLVPASTSNANGGDPNSLFQISDGSFYGTTRYGNDSGPTPDGTVFQLVVSTSSSNPCTASTNPTSNGGVWSGGEVASGTTTVTPTATGTFIYSLSCTYPLPTGTIGPQTAQLIVNAAATPAPTVTLTATPNSVTLGQSSTLAWTSTNSTNCTASGAWTGGEAVSGSLTVTPSVAGAQTYTLTCTGAGGSASATATLTASASTAPVPSVTLTVNPTSIIVGQSATLTWTSTNATSCEASVGWSGNEPVTGSQNVTPTAAGNVGYTLTCAGSGGSTSASATLAVTAAPAPGVTLSVSPTTIALGQSVVVTWSSTNATSCTASGAWSGVQATAGSANETPSATGTAIYTLVCSGAGNPAATSSATVTVQAAAGSPGQTNLSGRAGGGSLGWSSLFALALLVALRARGAQRALTACALAVLAFIMPAAAQEAAPQWQFNWDQTYIGLRVGGGDYLESSAHLDAEVAASGFGGTDTSITHRRIAGTGYVGVPFYGPLSLELGYADLGRYPVAISTSSSDIPALSQTIARKLWSAGQAVTFGLSAPLDISSWFAIEPRLGLLAFRSKQEVFTPTGTIGDDRTGGGADAGASFLVHTSRSVYFGAGFDYFDLGGHGSVLMYSAEITYHFGSQ
jgi:uncharacterized repeat protein (TIGR03803 family)